MTYKKKLIEVAIPLEAINASAGIENNIHTGLPANLHTWWSRKPLGVARAALFASLVNDPSEECDSAAEEETRRAHLFNIVELLAGVDSGLDETTLALARAEIAKSNNGKLPRFWDPFCGGGSLPLEALRLGLEPIATDLNPVAVFITRVLIELAPRFARQTPINPVSTETELVSGRSPYEGLKEDLLYYGEKIGLSLAKTLGANYPNIELPEGQEKTHATPIAWIWSRTVECPNPSCRAHAPLVNKFWLSTHKGNEAFAEPIYDKASRRFRFEVRHKGQPRDGTVTRSGAVCMACNNPIPFDYIRSEGVAGRVGHQMMAMVADGSRSRVYLAPTEEQQEAAEMDPPADAPESALPASALGFRVQRYGLVRHRDLFTNRQLVALSCLADAIAAVRNEVLTASGGDKQYADLIQAFLALSLSRVAQTNNTLVRWLVRTSGTSKGTPAFDRQIVSMVWEFSEGNILGGSVGSWIAAIRNPLTALKCLPTIGESGKAVQADAADHDLGITDVVVSTDPPYFDAIGYADLSDFFYIWLRRAVGETHKDLFGTLLSPKSEDLSAALGRSDIPRPRATKQFLDRLSAAFKRIHDAASEDVPVTIYYAFKQAESSEDSDGNSKKPQSSGWSTLLDSVIQAGFQITGTWPLRTESVSRLRAIGSNALATSILLVCRKKIASNGVISRAEFLRGLKRELPAAIAELLAANIAPADMPQSAIGPGMGVFSRYEAVLESDDSPMTVKAALQIINRELDEYLGGIQGEFDADTRFAITWFEQNGMIKGDYGTANSIATARGISVESVKHAGIVESAAGKVRILTRDELADAWEPDGDNHLTVWECLQHLVKKHEKDGISHDTAVLLKRIGTLADAVKDLAYCLYDISANKRKDAKEATAYNALIADWTELTRQAATIHDTSGDRQIRMDI
jgi:putative DNA methylase